MLLFKRWKSPRFYALLRKYLRPLSLTPPEKYKTSDNPSPARSTGWDGPGTVDAPRSAAVLPLRLWRRSGAFLQTARPA